MILAPTCDRISLGVGWLRWWGWRVTRARANGCGPGRDGRREGCGPRFENEGGRVVALAVRDKSRCDSCRVWWSASRVSGVYCAHSSCFFLRGGYRNRTNRYPLLSPAWRYRPNTPYDESDTTTVLMRNTQYLYLHGWWIFESSNLGEEHDESLFPEYLSVTENARETARECYVFFF